MQAAQVPVSSPSAPTRQLQGNFILLRADKLRLLLPQEGIQSTDYLQGRPELIEGETGLLHIPDSEDGAVYVAVGSDMHLLDMCPADRFVTTSMHGLDVRWCWSEVRVLMQANLYCEALPAVLLSPHTPVREIVAVGNDWAYLCSAEGLQQFALSAKN
ncbi:MAG: hypothetical protein Q4G39_06610 [Brachymonas sp.]|nr:hypothetical protein [Brachymonas sp.]